MPEMEIRPVAVAIVGCGAVGSYYGALLCRAGHTVHCLLRSDFEAVARNGIQIQSPQGDFVVRPHAHRSTEEIGTVNLVLIALKSTANAALPQLLPPLRGPETLFVSLQNGLGDEEAVADIVGTESVLGGLCFVCLNRIAPGIIRHTAHGLIVLGEQERPPLPRTHALAGLFQHAGIPCRVTEDLARAHWEKLVWNIPFNGLGVAGTAGWPAVESGHLDPARPPGPTLPTNRLLGDPRWAERIRNLMLEIIATANALGHRLPTSLAEEQIARTRVMADYKASTLLDFEQGRALELESLFIEPLRRARAAGVSTPCLASLCRVLTQLEGRAD